MYGGIHFSSGPDPDNISRMDHGAMAMIHDFHRFGIRTDVPYLNSMSDRINTREREIESIVRGHIGSYQYRHSKHGLMPFSIGSRDHLSQLLFEELRVQGDVPLARTPAGKRFEVSEEVLKPFASNHPIVPLINEWHSIDKIRNTYSDTLPLLVDTESRLHTTFNVTVAATGRLSSSNPNLQNIPIRTKLGKEVRGAFISSPGMVLVSNDLAQIEMVWAAHRSQDPVMLDIFRRRQDLHTRTACVVYHLDYEERMALTRLVEAKQATPAQIADYNYFKQFQRLPCKTVGFGVLYGQTPEGLQTGLAADGIFWTIEQCTEFVEKSFFGVYTKLREMLERDYATVKRYGLIWDDFGRVRLVPEAKSALKKISNEGTRKGGNHPEQSGAQGNIKISMASLTPLYRRLNSMGIVVRPLLQIHDQLISEVQADFAEEWGSLVSQDMENAVPLSIPVRSSCDIAERWMEL